MLAGVMITPLRQIKDERGTVSHMLKSTDPHFLAFGEIYFSSVNPGFVKAWNCHQELTANLAAVSGNARLVLFDGRESSATYQQLQSIEFGEKNYCLVTVPPGIWLGFTAIEQMALIANCATLPHRREESLQKPSNDPSIPYLW